MLWIFSIVVFLLLLVSLVLYVPAVQNFVKDKAVSYLKNKTNTEVRLESIHLVFPKSVELKGFYIEDQKKDTLLYAGKLNVNISMLQLLKNNIDVQHATLENVTTHIYRKLPDTTFNFAFITKAFAAADTSKKVEDTSKSPPLTFSLGKIEIANIFLTYDDDVTGNDALLRLGKLETNIKEFDLEKPAYVLDQLLVNNLSGHLYQRKGLLKKPEKEQPPSENKQSMMPELGIHKINLNTIDLYYKNEESGMVSALKIGDFTTLVQKIDLQKQKVAISAIELNNASAIYSLNKKTTLQQEKAAATLKKDTATNNWQVSVARVLVKNTALKYDNNPVKPISKGMDFNHLQVNGLAIDVNDINYNGSAISAAVKNIAFNEKSGFVLKKLTADAVYDETHASLKNFQLITNNTEIANSFEVTYPSIDAVSKDIGLLGVDATITNFKLGVQDVLFFQPQLAGNPDFNKLLNKTIVLKGDINGRVNDLKIKGLMVKAGTQTLLSMDAKLKGLPKIEQSVFDISLKQFTTSKTDIDYLVPANYLPASVRIPTRLSLNGNFKGSLHNFNTDLLLKTSSGNAIVNAIMIAGTTKGTERYSAKVALERLNIGYILKNDSTLGKVTLNASLKGTGTTINNANAQLKGTVTSIDIKGYEYKGLKLDGAYRQKVLTAQTSIADANVSFALDLMANLQQKYPAVTLNGIIDSIDLAAINLSTDNIKFRGEINADVPTADIDHLNGKVELVNFLILKEKQSFPIDSIELVAKSTADSNRIDLKSPILRASLKGKYQLSKLGEAVNQIIDQYFSRIETKKKELPPQEAELQATILYPKYLKELVPAISRFQTGTITGKINSQQGLLTINGNIPTITYTNIAVDSLKINVNTDSSKLAYKISFAQLVHPEITMHATRLYGQAKDDALTIDLQVKDEKNKEKYFLEGLFKAQKENYEFMLGKRLLLNYDKWQVAEDNRINYGPSTLTVSNLKIAQNNQFLLIDSKEGNGNPIAIDFHQFNLETLSKIAEQDSAAISGVLNGNAIIEDVMNNPVFVADLKISAFRFKESKVGDIGIKVNNKQANAYAADVTITGEGNDVQLAGTYFTQPQSSFDLDLAINKLNMRSVESFTFGQIRNATGTVNGKLKINGTVDAPKVNGTVRFNRTGFILSYLNSYFTMRNERINFNDQGIQFEQFTIRDSARNDAVIDGYVYTNTFRDYRFDLHVTTDNFRALNTKQSNNDLYYGPVYIDSDIKITGTMEQPKVNIDAKLRENSVLTVVLPSGTPSVVEREGVIEFVDMDLVRKGIFLTYENPDSTVARTTFKGFEMSANIEVDKDAELHLIVDQQSGDNLRVKGTAVMNATMDLSGKLSLTGTYQITEGAYELSLSGIVRRKFDIKEGSSITWTGEPTSANVDITAVYKTETSAMELFENQVANATAADRNKYKQKLPFEVELYIKNELMHPEISFGIDMPEEERSRYAISSSVYNRIKQINLDESELNKQVLGLLVMNRFIASNPFSSLESGGSGVEGMARQSASKLLSEQLNNLAGDLIKGVDLTFDLQSEEDYSTGQLENRTDLNVGVSKQLFGGRTTVYVGSNFELEGQEAANRKSTNIAGDVSIEYLISRDGRYRLRAYRKDEYESVIEGQVVETGLSFILTMDYNKFKELFQKSKEPEKKNKKRRRGKPEDKPEPKIAEPVKKETR